MDTVHLMLWCALLFGNIVAAEADMPEVPSTVPDKCDSSWFQGYSNSNKIDITISDRTYCESDPGKNIETIVEMTRCVFIGHSTTSSYGASAA